MSPSRIQLFQTEILKDQVFPPDLLALFEAVSQAGDDGVDPLNEALDHRLLVPGRDYPLLSGSYLNDADRRNPDIMANVAAIADVVALCTFVAESDDGDIIGYWHGPERTPIDAAPIVKFDTEGQFSLLLGRSLSEALLGACGMDDETGFAEARRWLAEQGIMIEATGWRELSAPECVARPDTLHLAFYNEKRMAAGLKPVRRR